MIDPALPTAIKFVRQYKAKKVVYDVEMLFAADSQAIRDAFGLFWRKKSGKRLPAGLKGISVSNVTTFPTRVRLRLLKEICHLHQAANPSVSCFVTSYSPRPELKIRDRKGPLVSYTYTKAISKLSYHLSLDFLRELYHYARTNLPEEEVAERFLILNSDLLCTSAGDLISMSVDEVEANGPPLPPTIPSLPGPSAPNPTSSSTPLSSAPPQASFVPTPVPMVGLPGTFATAPPPPPGQSFPPSLPSSLPATSMSSVPLQGQLPTQGQVPFSSFQPASQPATVTSPTLPGAETLEDDFTPVDRRGRTRFSQRAAPY
jgi:hypothetical protein